MDQKQFDAMLSDGETRLQRLKMLYEQWFLGFERLEPAILRKEFEDLLAMLRREQVANTALRFRLQGLVQRHTTFATHWRRVARQIEDGTYQRDVLRARRVREQAAERDNAGPELELSYDVDLDDELQAALEEANREAELASAKRQPAVLPPTAAGQVSGARPPVGLAAAPAAPRPTAAVPADAAPVPANAGASTPRNGGPRAISPFAMPSAAGGAAKAPALQPSAAKLLGAIAPANDTRADAAAAAPTVTGANAKAAGAAAATGASAKAPGTAPAPGANAKAAGTVAATGASAKAAGTVAAPGASAKAAGTAGATGASAKAAGAAATGPDAKAAGAPAASGANAKAAGAPAASGANANGAGTSAAASGATVGSAATNGAAAARAGAGVGARATASLALSAAAAAAARSAGSAAGANGTKATSAATASPSARTAATQAAVAGKPTAAPAAGSGSAALSNDDVQRIYTQYVSARKQNAERVDNVKLDSIEKTLRGMLPQLEKKHIGKKIDFEVVVKDGKVALKPVAR